MLLPLPLRDPLVRVLRLMVAIVLQRFGAQYSIVYGSVVVTAPHAASGAPAGESLAPSGLSREVPIALGSLPCSQAGGASIVLQQHGSGKTHT